MITDHSYCFQHKIATATWPVSDLFNTKTIYIYLVPTIAKNAHISLHLENFKEPKNFVRYFTVNFEPTENFYWEKYAWKQHEWNESQN